MCRVEGETADSMHETVGHLLPAGQEAGGAHGLGEDPQVLSSARPHGRTTVPEEQRASQRPEGETAESPRAEDQT